MKKVSVCLPGLSDLVMHLCTEIKVTILLVFGIFALNAYYTLDYVITVKTFKSMETSVKMIRLFSSLFALVLGLFRCRFLMLKRKDSFSLPAT